MAMTSAVAELVLAMAAAVTAAAAAVAALQAPVGLPGCATDCGGVSVPYPFGMGPPRCYWPGFNLTCDTTSGAGAAPRLLLGDGTLRVAAISLKNATVRVVRAGSAMDAAALAAADGANFSFGGGFVDHGYMLSNRNELVLSGCNLLATLLEDLGPGRSGIVSQCATFCSFRNKKVDSIGQQDDDGGGHKYCSGMGCCQAPINYHTAPVGLRVRWLDAGNHTEALTFLPAYVFVAEEGWFDQRPLADELLSVKRTPSREALQVPFLLLWRVKRGLPPYDVADNTTRDGCPGDASAALCKSDHSACATGDRGYICQCQDGYDGNPYLAGGCQELLCQNL